MRELVEKRKILQEKKKDIQEKLHTNNYEILHALLSEDGELVRDFLKVDYDKLERAYPVKWNTTK